MFNDRDGSSMVEAHLVDITTASHHRQHCDQVINSGILFKNAVQCFNIPGARLGVSPRHITCVLRRKMWPLHPNLHMSL